MRPDDLSPGQWIASAIAGLPPGLLVGLTFASLIPIDAVMLDVALALAGGAGTWALAVRVTSRRNERQLRSYSRR